MDHRNAPTNQPGLNGQLDSSWKNTANFTEFLSEDLFKQAITKAIQKEIILHMWKIKKYIDSELFRLQLIKLYNLELGTNLKEEEAKSIVNEVIKSFLIIKNMKEKDYIKYVNWLKTKIRNDEREIPSYYYNFNTWVGEEKRPDENDVLYDTEDEDIRDETNYWGEMNKIRNELAGITDE